ncbi:MAG: hypothetical protein JNM63_04080, partial [Spirochaetia bacterium]|nr:hypothetical protein [Spirochaetia bacterium]
DKRVYAHYVAWHFSTDTSFSLLDHYDAAWLYPTKDQVKDYRQEIDEAIRSGIDGFFVDVVIGAGAKSAGYLDQTKTLLKAAEGTPFHIGICLDGNGDKGAAPYAELLLRMITNIASHSNYPRVDGKPVFTTYGSTSGKPEFWNEVRRLVREAGSDYYLCGDISASYSEKVSATKIEEFGTCFDMFYFFGCFRKNDAVFQTVDEIGEIASGAVRKLGKGYMPALWPGYLGGWIGGRNDYYVPYRGFDQLFENFETQRKTGADWLHITTWNDLEETPFYPMFFTFHANREILKAFSDDFKGLAPVGEEPRIYLAYHREEIIGSTLRIEGLSIPTKTRSEKATISGYLEDAEGKAVAELREKSFSTREFSRIEWQIPTAELGRSPALIPVVRIQTRDGYRLERKLPAVFPVTGWIQNQITVRVPIHEMSAGTARLEITANRELLDAKLSFQLDESVVRATLWRNDRPIGVFGAKETKPVVCLEIRRENAPSLSLSVKNGRILAANQFGQGAGPSFRLSNNTLDIEKTPSWSKALLVEIEDEGEALVTVSAPKAGTRTISMREMCRSRGFTLSGSGAVVNVGLCGIDGFVNDRPEGSFASQTLSLQKLTRESYENDRFYARLETKSGKVFYSPVVAPFTVKTPMPVQVLSTSVNLETVYPIAKAPVLTGFLEPPVPENASLVKVPVHPSCFRAMRYDFENEWVDTLGERDLPPLSSRNAFTQDARASSERSERPANASEDGEKCLAFNGKGGVKMRLRTWPLGSCQTLFRIKPFADRKDKQEIISTTGTQPAITVSLMPDGKLLVSRIGRKLFAAEEVTTASIPDQSWTDVKITFDEKRLAVFLNGKLSVEKELPIGREFANNTMLIGKSFTGLFDRLEVRTPCPDQTR